MGKGRSSTIIPHGDKYSHNFRIVKDLKKIQLFGIAIAKLSQVRRVLAPAGVTGTPVRRSEVVNSQAVLILGNYANKNLVQAVASIGLTPQVFASMRQCLGKLVRERFAAVVIDRKSTDADVLEFILNVRDIDKAIPVAVVGRGKDERIEKKIINQDYTVILAELEKVEALAQRLSEAVKMNED